MHLKDSMYACTQTDTHVLPRLLTNLCVFLKKNETSSFPLFFLGCSLLSVELLNFHQQLMLLMNQKSVLVSYKENIAKILKYTMVG